MAFENLFIRTRRSIEGIQLDAVLSETHTNVVRKTTNPIELGAEITDHSIIEPKTLNIVAQISDTPLGFQAVTQLVDSVSGLFGSSTADNLTRSQVAYNDIIKLQEKRELVKVQTRLKLYENMLIIRVFLIEDKDTSRIVRMNIDLEQIIIVESEIIQLSPEQIEEGSTRDQASSAVDSGRKESVVPNEAVDRSFLKSLINYGFGK